MYKASALLVTVTVGTWTFLLQTELPLGVCLATAAACVRGSTLQHLEGVIY